MKKNSQRGFTLIELLVVIAIIGILASVVLASLNTARDKGADAKIKAELSNARAQAQTYFEDNGVYFFDTADNVCTDPDGIYPMFVSSASVTNSALIINGNQSNSGNANCNVFVDDWVIQVPLKQENQLSETSGVDYYCVDSHGITKIEDDPLAVFVLDETVDPATASPTRCL